MPEVVVCGPASWNHVVRLDALPPPVPHMQRARGDVHTLGGTSAGKALHLRDLGRAARLHTVVGTDSVAGSILAALGAVGADTAAEVADGPSERHLNLMDVRGGRVSLYLDLPGLPTGPVPDLLCADLAGSRAVVMDLGERSRDLLPTVRASGVPVWTDVHDYDGSAAFHAPFLAAASYVFMNGDGLDDPLDFMRATVAGGAQVVVCTLGADGAMAVDRDQRVHRVPALEVAEVVDTNGAGDGFLCGFLDATLDGAGVPDALHAGARQAARALSSHHLSPLLDGWSPGA